MDENPYHPPTIPSDRPAFPTVYPSRLMRAISIVIVVSGLLTAQWTAGLSLPTTTDMAIIGACAAAMILAGILVWFAPSRWF